MLEESTNPIAGASSHSVVFDLKVLTKFSENGPQAVILADTGAAQVVLLGMRAGQTVADVRSPSQLIAQAMRGRATLRIATTVHALRAGLLALVEANTLHTFTATTDCVLLLTLTPSPEQQQPAHALLADLIAIVSRETT